jgi:predicted nucleic acid-binding protein
MASILLDVSAALDVLLDGKHAASIHNVLDKAEAVYAPALYAAESANALWKYVSVGRMTAEVAAASHRAGLALIDGFVPDEELFPEALAEACRLRHPVYDLLYVTASKRSGSILATLDKRLTAIARKVGVTLVEL